MGTLLRMKNKRVIGKASLCDRGLTETRPSLSASARKTREYVQAATGRACTGVLLCLQGCRQGIVTHGQREGRQLLMWHPQGTARAHFPPPWHSHPSLHIRYPLSAPLIFAWCFSPRGGSHILLYTILQALCICSLGNTEYHRAASLSHWVSEQGC